MDNTDINKKLKNLTIFLGITFLFGLALLVIAIILKNNLSVDNNSKKVKSESLNTDNDFQDIVQFGESCSPTHIEYKENYIAIHSDICKKILIINTSTGREIYKNY